MHTTRRKSPNYPVALALAFCIANIAHAQLCLTAAERNYLPVFIGKIDQTLTIESKPAFAQISQLNAALPTSFAYARVQDMTTPEIDSRTLLPATLSEQKELAPAFRLKDESLQKLLIAATLPTQAGIDPLSAFAE